MSSLSKSVSEERMCSNSKGGGEGEMTSMEEVDQDLEVLTAAANQFILLVQQGVKMDGYFGPGLATVRKNMEELKRRVLEGDREREELMGEKSELTDEVRVLKRRLEVKDGALERMRKDHSLEMDRRIRAEVELKKVTSVAPRPMQEMHVALPAVPSAANFDVETGGENSQEAGAETTKKPVRKVLLIERKREYWESSGSSSDLDGGSDSDSDKDDRWRFPFEVASQIPLATTQPAPNERNMDEVEEAEAVNNLIIASVADVPADEDPSEEPVVQPRPIRRSRRTGAKKGQGQVRAAMELQETGQARNSPDGVSHSRKRKETSIPPPVRSSRRLGGRSTQGLGPTVTNHPMFSDFKVELPSKQGRRKKEVPSHGALQVPDPQPGQKGNLVCRTCIKAFPNKSALNHHMRIRHSSDRPFQCPQCPARFKQIYHFKQHMEVHSDRRPFKCSHCPARFNYKSVLNKHVVVHSNRKPFKCLQCSACFKLQRYLKSHMSLVHSKRRPFKCLLCGKSLKTKSSLNVHLRVHTGQRPYSCLICGKSFTQSSSLKLHMRVIHEGEKRRRGQRINNDATSPREFEALATEN